MAFAYRHQPVKAFYLLFSGLTILFIRLPYWTISSVIPSLRPRRSWSITRTITVRALQAFVSLMYDVGFSAPPDPTILSQRAKEPWIVLVKGLPEGLLTGTIASAAATNHVQPITICGYWSDQNGVVNKAPERIQPGQKVLLMLHGGGHVMGSGNPKEDSANVASPIIEKAGGLIHYVFSPEYRLAAGPPFQPINPFPANLLDALAAYKYLIDEVGAQPSDIIVSGISSGGHLALDLVLYLVQSKFPSLPLPAGLLLLSPTVDWAGSHDDEKQSSMNRNSDADIVGPILKSGYTRKALLGELPDSEIATNPYLSPASLRIADPKGIFTGFPPTFIVAGEAEQTLDPMRTLSDRIAMDIGRSAVRLREYEDANHTFLTLSVFEPERSRALDDIRQWLAEILG